MIITNASGDLNFLSSDSNNNLLPDKLLLFDILISFVLLPDADALADSTV